MLGLSAGIGVAAGWPCLRRGQRDASPPLLDLDWERQRFSFGGEAFASEAALLAAPGGMRDGAVLTFGPQEVGGELVSNGSFDTDADDWGHAGAPGSLALSQIGGKLRLVRGSGAFSAARCAVQSAGAGRAVRLQFDLSGGLLRFAPVMSGGAPVVPSAVYWAGSWTLHGATGHAAPEGWIDADFWPSDPETVAEIDNVSVREVVPLEGFSPSGVTLSLRGRTGQGLPAAPEVLVQLDAGGETDRVRVQWGSDGHLRVITTATGAEQTRIDLGLVTPGSVFAVDLMAAAGEVRARMDGGSWFVQAALSHPGLAFLRLGQSFSGEGWTGEIDGARLWAGASLEQWRIAMWGDSLTQSLAEVVGASLVPPRVVFNGGVGGEDTVSIAQRMLADDLYRDRITVLWDRANTAADNARYLATVAAMVARIRERHDRWIVVSDINRTDGTEAPGSPWRVAQDDRNRALQAAYGDHFLDVTAALDDLALRSDGLHLNAQGNAVVTAALGAFLQERGW